MRTHPAAEVFPLLPEPELAALAEDIRANGLAQPITVYRGEILDGRNRLLACERAGVAPRFAEWNGSGSPTAYVVSQNLRRRHLTDSQRAMVGAALVPLFEEEAKARMLAGKAQIMEPAAYARKHPTANLREGGTAAAQAASAVNVSPRSVESALKVTREAKPEVVEAVKRGEVAVSAAAKALPRKLSPFATRPRKAPKKPKSEPAYTFTLIVPASSAGAMQRALEKLGFEVCGRPSRTGRKMHLNAA